MGAVLYQEHEDGLHPVEFRSKRLAPHQQRYAAHVREFLAVLYALKQYRCYLQGREFTLLTDNAALAQIQSSRELNPMFARWFLLFEEFPCNVAHRPGKSLVPEDACSRIPSHHPLRPSATFDPDDEWAARDSFLSLPDFDPAGDREAARHARPVSAACPSDGSEAGCYAALAALRDAARDDGDAVVRDALHGRFDFASAAHWREWYAQCPDFAPYWNDGAGDQAAGYVVRGDQLFFSEGGGHERLCIPRGRQDAARREFLEEVHASRLGAHRGRHTTTARAVRYAHWPRMKRDIDAFVRSCHTCQVSRDRRAERTDKKQSSTPTAPWDRVSIDFVGPLPKSAQDHDSIFTVICDLTGVVHLIPCCTTDSAYQVAQRFLREVVRLHGVPAAIRSDRDARFTSKFWRALCKLIGSRLKMACAFHPQSNGKVERMHHALGDILRCVVNARQDDWEAALPMAELAINDSPSAATGFTPFQACYGRDPRTPLTAATGTEDGEQVPAAREHAAYLEAIFTMVRDAMRRHKDETCGFRRVFKYQPFAVGDEVLLATKNLKVKRDAACGKLTCRYIGPFKIKAIADRSATLDLPSALRITPHVSVDFLRRYVPRQAFRGTDDRRNPPGPIIDEEGKERYEIEKLLARRVRSGQVQYLIRWEGYPPEEDTWEHGRFSEWGQ